MKRYKWLIAIGVLAVFGLLMLTVNVRLARSATNTSTQFTSAGSPNPNATRVSDLDRVFLHVEDRVGLASALASELRNQLRESGKFTVVLLNNEPGPEDLPLLRVGIRDKRGFWSPFYARTRVKVLARYSSVSTELPLDSGESVTVRGSDEQGRLPIQIRAEIEVDDSTAGLVTLTAYRRMLAKNASDALVDFLRKSVDKTREDAAKKEDSP
ncbi:MAG: hypothetical protein IT365_19235 [Candidatus Hydrogenedentes bacterium]|nr:hypothetical protein [Candidatus Hydrogenedentota bacterium]